MDPILGAALISGGASLVGGLIGGNATRNAQQQANRIAQDQATAANRQNWSNYLLSRGINPGLTGLPDTNQFVAQNPQLRRAYDSARAQGDRRTFDQWLQDHLREAPQDATSMDFAAQTGAVNTFLPLWAQIGGRSAEQALFEQILNTAQPKMAGDAEAAYVRSVPAGDVQWWNDRMREYGVSTIAEAIDRWEREHPGEALQAGESQLLDAYRSAAAAPAAPVVDPRITALQDRIFGAANDLYDGRFLSSEVDALAPILAARQAAADEIFGATRTGADDLFAAAERGARSIYDADLLQADTYQQSALQALNRVLAEQRANRARQGFIGSGSGEQLLRARLTADSSQKSAGVRAAAGQTLAQRLAAADVTRADALGRAGIDRASTRGAAGEQDALSRLSLLTNDINRRLASVSLPSTLATNSLTARRAAEDEKFAGIDALLARLNTFRQQPVAAPGLVQPNVSPAINGGQIAGGLISSLGDAAGSYFNTKALLEALGSGSGGSSERGYVSSWKG